MAWFPCLHFCSQSSEVRHHMSHKCFPWYDDVFSKCENVPVPLLAHWQRGEFITWFGAVRKTFEPLTLSSWQTVNLWHFLRASGISARYQRSGIFQSFMDLLENVQESVVSNSITSDTDLNSPLCAWIILLSLNAALHQFRKPLLGPSSWQSLHFTASFFNYESCAHGFHCLCWSTMLTDTLKAADASMRLELQQNIIFIIDWSADYFDFKKRLL